jgi:hypothetical protein
MFDNRRVLVLSVGLLKGKIDVTEEVLQNLEKSLQGKELLGQTLGPHETFMGKLNPAKVSHVVKNFKYYPLAKSLLAEIEYLPTDYGIHLATILEKRNEKIDFVPAFLFDDQRLTNISAFRLLTMNAVLKGPTNDYNPI